MNNIPLHGVPSGGRRRRPGGAIRLRFNIVIVFGETERYEIGRSLVDAGERGYHEVVVRKALPQGSFPCQTRIPGIRESPVFGSSTGVCADAGYLRAKSARTPRMPSYHRGCTGGGRQVEGETGVSRSFSLNQ